MLLRKLATSSVSAASGLLSQSTLVSQTLPPSHLSRFLKPAELVFLNWLSSFHLSFILLSSLWVLPLGKKFLGFSFSWLLGRE